MRLSICSTFHGDTVNTITIHASVFLVIFGAGYACRIFAEVICTAAGRLFDLAVDRLTRREYIRLIHDGTPCIMTPGDACDTLQDADDPKVYKVESVYLTNRQFRALPEFLGW